MPKMLKEVINYYADVANQIQFSYSIYKKATFVVIKTIKRAQ